MPWGGKQVPVCGWCVVLCCAVLLVLFVGCDYVSDCGIVWMLALLDLSFNLCVCVLVYTLQSSQVRSGTGQAKL
jgi:hypothetical protein